MPMSFPFPGGRLGLGWTTGAKRRHVDVISFSCQFEKVSRCGVVEGRLATVNQLHHAHRHNTSRVLLARV